MAGTPQYADVSQFQGAIDWAKYKQWASQWDGISRVAMRSSYGTGYIDQRFQENRAAALAAGIDVCIFYHYAYPSLNPASAEADWQKQVVGSIRPNDLLMLDFEEATPTANAVWAYSWLSRQEANYSGRLPIIYASDSYIRARLQDSRLARFPLVLANWTYDPAARPACPPPWSHYTYLQYSDKAVVPGIPGAVDANVYLGGATTSTYELANFPMISQRDGDANADFDCVPASIAACMQWLTSTHYTASEIKDAVYGATYTGGTAATAYVAYCAARGVKLAPVNGNGSALVTALRASLAAQHPALITEPDPYMPTSSGFSHVCAAYKCDATTITVMDPWIDKPVTKSDAEWASELEFNQIWTLEKHMPVPTGWTDKNNTLTAANGVPVVQGFRDHILNAASWNGANQPFEAEYHTDQVLLHNPSVGAGQRQMFRDTMLWYTPAAGVREEPYLGWELDAAYKQIDQIKAQLAAQTPAPVDNTALLNAINAIADGIAPLVAAALVEAKKL